MSQKIALAIVAVFLVASMAFVFQGHSMVNGLFPLPPEGFVEGRTKILNELSDAIGVAVKEGKYHCCIDPPCTMCFLGDWLWDDGTCDCDGMIAKGEFDKVCPQCKRGIEEGRCISSAQESCEV